MSAFFGSFFGAKHFVPGAEIRMICSDYDVFLSPLEDFKKKMEEAGLQDKVVYLDRKDRYRFQVKQ